MFWKRYQSLKQYPVNSFLTVFEDSSEWLTDLLAALSPTPLLIRLRRSAHFFIYSCKRFFRAIQDHAWRATRTNIASSRGLRQSNQRPNRCTDGQHWEAPKRDASSEEILQNLSSDTRNRVVHPVRATGKYRTHPLTTQFMHLSWENGKRLRKRPWCVQFGYFDSFHFLIQF